MNHNKYLNKLGACLEAVEWASHFKTLQEVWDKCERGDWMLWLLGEQAGGSRSKSFKKLVITTCKCARLSLKYIPKKEKRPLAAIQTAEKWARGEKNISLQDVKNAADAVVYASHDNLDAACSYALDGVTEAVDAYYFYDSDIYEAFSVAKYVAAADSIDIAPNTSDYDSSSAGKKALKKCADIVRKYHPIIKTNNRN